MLYLTVSICAFWLIAAACHGSPALPTISVCELFRAAEKWDGQVVRVTGLARLGKLPEVRLSVLSPIPPESCNFMGTDEPAEIGLRLPGQDFLRNPPPNYNYDVNSIRAVLLQLNELLEKNSKVEQVMITVEGAVALRRYRRSDIPEGPAGVVPAHILFPITMTVQSYKGLMLPNLHP